MNIICYFIHKSNKKDDCYCLNMSTVKYNFFPKISNFQQLHNANNCLENVYVKKINFCSMATYCL